jgi:hypothetical protein
MATGTSACIHLRNIKRPQCFVRNEGHYVTVGQGLSKLNLRQFPRRKIHTIRQITVTTRTDLSSRPTCALVSDNQSALDKRRLTHGAFYIASHRSVHWLSKTSRLFSQPLVNEQLLNKEDNLGHGYITSSSSPPENKKNQRGNEREKARILIEQLQPEFDALVALFRCKLLIIGRPKVEKVEKLSDSSFRATSEVHIAGAKHGKIEAKIEASSLVCATTKACLDLFDCVSNFFK